MPSADSIIQEQLGLIEVLLHMNTESGTLKVTLALYVHALCSYLYTFKDNKTSTVYDKYWEHYHERLLDI